ncbi:hypothetical protein EMIHUDRAFT_112827 [Emiliania huxleyi CCMP1516]|uniref:Lipase maturation factor 1 n=2 Tax=Emiliania huxleyi TaxID=2903 RepID=A0A0D3K6W3_EMIH1|nr:hypothetical protein EMIHUDRAFT_112827 [Emiliania huxleyi CCMP1516]EOD31498.1 hypothetical protein EMIHUDRAFT_112827 [Emiliania huxleyi CCMP1516]|eukprot:XP_005783927.1 hypothetical protein EMIHUDRAFT_112827 [Emiliania huxleyi CCMP1516]
MRRRGAAADSESEELLLVSTRATITRKRRPNRRVLERKWQTFVVTKHVMLRLLGAVYFFAFLGAYLQNGALLGERGLMPAKPHLERLQKQNAAGGGSRLDGFLSAPSVYWWLPLSDASLDGVAAAGVAIASLVCCGLHSSAAMAAMWLLYFSLVTAAEGSTFYQ